MCVVVGCCASRWLLVVPGRRGRGIKDASSAEENAQPVTKRSACADALTSKCMISRPVCAVCHSSHALCGVPIDEHLSPPSTCLL
jgi:hypothetical protein